MKVFLIAGEASGDRLGASLMAGLKQLGGEIGFDGVGGEGMMAQGLKSRFPMQELSVMGLAEVLPRLRGLLRRRDEMAAAVLETRPDVLITIDSPDFCLRVARKVKSAAPAIRTVHYVAPSVWAWRPKRADKMAQVIDHVLALLPFEPPYMTAAGMSCDFVGHPASTDPVASPEQAATIRAELGIADGATVLTVLPGSRMGEIGRLAPVFGAALSGILDRRPDVRIVVPAAPGMADTLSGLIRSWPGRPVILDPRGHDPAEAEARKRALFRGSQLALAASGTVALELAGQGTPMVIAYDMNWLSRRIVASMLRVDSVNLVNLVTGARTIPELLGNDCRPETIAPALLDLLENPEARQAQIAVEADAMARLGRGGEAPGLRAARSVLSLLR